MKFGPLKRGPINWQLARLGDLEQGSSMDIGEAINMRQRNIALIVVFSVVHNAPARYF